MSLIFILLQFGSDKGKTCVNQGHGFCPVALATGRKPHPLIKYHSKVEFGIMNWPIRSAHSIMKLLHLSNNNYTFRRRITKIMHKLREFLHVSQYYVGKIAKPHTPYLTKINSAKPPNTTLDFFFFFFLT